MIYPESHLYIEQARARELRAEARHRRLLRALDPPRAGEAWRTRLGWLLVETGLRLVQRRSPIAHS
ncbi:hypothetical protein [Nonomuraea jiangxiensis]|uniref:Uncharacterized protein n=1 Tax=Nonomuraea jiangxiensis TaxID=633440 RepID=A0A1G8YCI2_9ACTN|nr:hypothetical protein [Nonomuraea jiangxiensis]SDK00619.1 hypothetical protein SAMN05421869_113239 [Nonomuraea jiangxiensis]